MTDLFESNQQEDMSVFEVPPKVAEVEGHAPSEVNLAAQGAIIEGGDLLGSFTKLEMMSSSDRLVALNNMVASAKSEQDKATANILGGIVQDPYMSEEAKKTMVMSASGISQEKTNSLQVMGESLHTVVVPSKDEDEEFRLLESGEVLADTIEIMRLKQAAIALLSVDEDTGEKVEIASQGGLRDFVDAMLPFSEQAMQAQIKDKMDNGEINSMWDFVAYFLTGESVAIQKEIYETADSETRKRLLKALPQLVNSAKTIAVTNDNDLLQLNSILSIADHEHYGNFERVVDDIASALDLVGAGSLIRSLTRAQKAAKMHDIVDAYRRNTAAKVPTTTPFKTAQQANPPLARKMLSGIVEDEVGTAAEAMASANRADVVVDALAPQVRTERGNVEAKPAALDRDIAEAAYEGSSKFYLTPEELENTIPKLRDSLQSVGYPVVRPDLSPAPKLDSGTGTYAIVQTYSDVNGGWVNPELALKTTLEDLEYFGVKEKDLTLLQKRGDEYVKVELKDVVGKKVAREAILKNGQPMPKELAKVENMDEYVVQASFTYDPRSIDIVREDMPVSMNWMERFRVKAPKAGGSIATKHVFSGAALLNSAVFQGGIVAVDRASTLHQVLSDTAKSRVFDPLAKLGKESQLKIDKVIRDQNMARKRFTRIELSSSYGIVDEKELAILDGIKHVNDQLWHLTNRDMAKTLRDSNHSFYVDSVNGDKLVAKIVNGKSALPKKAYDPIKKKNVNADQLWDDVVKNGEGKIVRLRKPQWVDDVEVTHIAVRKGDSSRYVKSIQLDDHILPYTEGYLHVSYKDPWFIDKYRLNAKGERIGDPEAVLTAPTLKDAKRATDHSTRTGSVDAQGIKYEYEYRRAQELSAVTVADRMFDVATNAGLSSQRRRGQTLKSFDSTRTEDMKPNLVDPLDTIRQQIAQIAKRVPMREYLDDLATRIISEKRYDPFLPAGRFGGKRLPMSGEIMKAPKDTASKEAGDFADLMAMVEHYNMMKYGYINSIDGVWNWALNGLGDHIGKVSSKGEKGVRALQEEVPSPLGSLKRQAFNANMAMSLPTSQWFVQGIPATLNAFLHTEYVFKGGLANDWFDLTFGMLNDKGWDGMFKKLPAERQANIKKLKKEWDKTGFASGIDKHLLVEGGLEHLVETTRFKPAKDLRDKVVDNLRVVGFDAGELVNMGVTWLAVRSDAIKNGKSMDNPRHFDEVRVKARALTLNMNKAGEQPWNKNAMSLFTQFRLAPWKATTMAFDKGLSGKERSRAVPFQLLVMPAPIGVSVWLGSQIELEGTEGEVLHEVLSNGLMGATFNLAANYMYEDAGSVSWQRYAQSDITTAGYLEFIHSLFTEDSGKPLIEQIANFSPSLGSWFGYNPVAANLASAVTTMVTSPFHADDSEEALHHLKDFIYSTAQYSAGGRGLSVAFQELLIDKYNRRLSAVTNKVVDPNITTGETIAKAIFGLNTTYQDQQRYMNRQKYLTSSKAYGDMDVIASNILRQSAIEGYSPGTKGRSEFLHRMVFEAYGEDMIPEPLLNHFWKKVQDSPSVTTAILRMAKIDQEAAEEMAEQMRHVSPEAKKMYEYYEDQETALKELKEEMDR